MRPLGGPEDVEATEQAILDAVSTGNTRTMQQDSIFHSAAILAELLRRDPPPRVLTGDGHRRVVLVEQPNGDDLVRLASDPLARLG